ncbi:MAG TPA: FMN-binding protein [Gaiellaceae bacterium]|nr:FMN-binding protein [Gaiellaceae bacterium]
MLAAAPAAAPIAAATRKVIVTTKTVTGPQGQADRWGYVEVTLVVKKTTTIVGKHKTIKRKITRVNVPIYPNHTDRSVFINEQALPLLTQEVLQAQFNPNIDMISGATATSFGFLDSLQAAIASAKKA